MTLQQWEDVVGYIQREIGWLCGLIAAIGLALTALHLPEPWHDYATIAAVVGTAASAYMLQPFKRRPTDIEPPKWGTPPEGQP